MFEQDMTEASCRSTIVEDIEPKAFRQLLQYLYTGDAPDLEDEDMTEPLFIAADKYQIQLWKDWCSSSPRKKLKTDNAIRLLVLAHLHSDESLVGICIDFISKEKSIFCERGDFKQLSKKYPDLFYEITRRIIMTNVVVNS